MAVAVFKPTAAPCAPLLGEVGDAARNLVRLDPRARHLTREHVCQRYVLAG